MDETPFQPADDLERQDYLLGRTRHLVLHLIAYMDSVLESLSGAPLGAPLARYLIRRVLLPAEAALRRAIILIATHLPPLAPPAPKPPGKPAQRPPASRPAGAAQPRAPLFRMAEPQPASAAPAGHLPEHLTPRITLISDLLRDDFVPRPAHVPRTVQIDPAALFLRRLAALRAACEDPAPTARRWLRRCAAQPGTARRTLAPARIPGAAHAIDETMASLLEDLTTAARSTPLLNTS